ncbi:SCO family protein [Bacillus methanolicus]|uniref:Cu2+-binding oxygen sensor protein n=1 Tax=Bacillus methanolicus (strain MGA3 / ATCC 53907) TaxID=796606 RepID=I3E9L9_BACMM|nr:SCO family protein [Bacillus methanolicus]AIE60438.1 Cu2+-binding oxygen sensor protein [Bacillus methanolicus MGA3]EIJ83190.1 electron transport protein SCO1/SenC [Bacillus methanolicus MGA3]
MNRKLISATVLILVLILSACGQNKIKNAIDRPLKDFTFTDQNGDKFGLKDLKGKVWVADFIYTNCPDVCPPMTFNMVKLQKKVKKEGIKNIQFVSFSVDPTVDKPETLKKYGEKYNADQRNWHFLTGYTQAEIEKFALDNFKALVKKPEKGDQVIHGTSFYLIDKNGHVMKEYTGLNDVPFDEIINDIKALQ